MEFIIGILQNLKSPRIFLLFYLLHHVCTSPIGEHGDNGTETLIGGEQLITMGEKLGKPLIELFGRALVNSDKSLKRFVSKEISFQESLGQHEIGQTFEKKLNYSITTLFGDLCEQRFCGDWTQWTACSGSIGGMFGATSRSRICGNSKLQFCQNEGKELKEEDTRVCKECGKLPIFANGYAKRHPKKPNLAEVTCNISHKATKDEITCLISGVWEEVNCEEDLPGLEDLPGRVPKDCQEVKYMGKSRDGVYDVTLLNSSSSIQVYCDMTTDGGGWTVFQNRFDGSVDFYRNFSEYEKGFGNVETEFWLGLKYIQEMTSVGRTELRIVLQAADGTDAFEVYTDFSLSNGTEYRLMLGNRTSSSNIRDDNFGRLHGGKPFSTYDRDLDNSPGNCAVDWHGAWWYYNCHCANLNGQYLAPGTKRVWKGMVYDSFRSTGESLKRSRMMFRRVE